MKNRLLLPCYTSSSAVVHAAGMGSPVPELKHVASFSSSQNAILAPVHRTLLCRGCHFYSAQEGALSAQTHHRVTDALLIHYITQRRGLQINLSLTLALAGNSGQSELYLNELWAL